MPSTAGQPARRGVSGVARDATWLRQTTTSRGGPARASSGRTSASDAGRRENERIGPDAGLDQREARLLALSDEPSVRIDDHPLAIANGGAARDGDEAACRDAARRDGDPAAALHRIDV